MLGDLVREGRGYVPAVNRRLYELIDAGWTEERVRAYDGTDDGGRWPDHPFRVSDLHRLCPRMVALARREPFREVYRADALWLFAVGQAYHDAIQRALATLPGATWRGWWQSNARAQGVPAGAEAVPERYRSAEQVRDGTLVVSGPGRAPIPRPEGDAWRYCEVMYLDDALGLRGHEDGCLVWGDGDEEGEEFKSIATFQADKHNPLLGGGPKEDHVIQAHGYMLLSGRRRQRVTYLVKASGDLGAVQMEHVVERDEAVIGGIRDLLGACRAALALGPTDPLPDPLGACDKRSRKRPGKCPAKARCFACR
jgi:hypothetical protein